MSDILDRAHILSEGHKLCQLPDDGRDALALLPELIAEIERLKEEADLTDIFEALENAGIYMGDGENPQDPITAIEVLGGKIKRLESEKAYWYEISGKQMQTVEEQHSRICKQLSALKKLGEMVRNRGKALVEERAWRNFFAANARTEAFADFGYSLVKDHHFTRSREQLRAEKVIR